MPGVWPRCWEQEVEENHVVNPGQESPLFVENQEGPSTSERHESYVVEGVNDVWAVIEGGAMEEVGLQNNRVQDDNDNFIDQLYNEFF